MIPMTTAQYDQLVSALGALGIKLERQEYLEPVDGNAMRWQSWINQDGVAVETVTRDKGSNLMFVFLPVQQSSMSTILATFLGMFEPF